MTGAAQGAATWRQRHLLGLEKLSAAELTTLLDHAEQFAAYSQPPRRKLQAPEGQGRRQPLLRAVHAHAHQLRPRRPPARGRHARLHRRRLQHSARARRSSTPPRTSRRWASTSWSSGTRRPARRTCWPSTSRCRVINAGDGAHEHPTQGLLDIFTIRQRRGRVEGLTVGLVGDIAHSRVARSNIHGLTQARRQVIVCGPPTLVPAEIERLGVEVVAQPRRHPAALRRASTCCASSSSGSGSGLFPSIARIRPPVRHGRRPAAAGEAGHAAAGPGPDQPRRRDHARGRRRPALGDPGAGDERRWPCAWPCCILLCGRPGGRRRP